MTDVKKSAIYIEQLDDGTVSMYTDLPEEAQEYSSIQSITAFLFNHLAQMTKETFGGTTNESEESESTTEES